MGYLSVTLYQMLLLGLVLGMIIGWFACDPKQKSKD